MGLSALENLRQLDVVILGGTGKTGKWAVKGALIRGYNVRLLVRSKEKAEKVMQSLFPPNPSELLSAVTLVEGSVTEPSKLAELFAGADVVLSFLGMAEPPAWAVRPGVEAVLTALRQLALLLHAPYCRASRRGRHWEYQSVAGAARAWQANPCLQPSVPR